MDVAQWLQDLGLPDYAALFRAQAIDADVLPSLTDADFEKLGLPLGHRKKLLTAIAALPAAPSSTASIRRPSHAERRQLSVMFVDLVGSTSLSTRLDPEAGDADCLPERSCGRDRALRGTPCQVHG